MPPERPDPDQLLQQVARDEARSQHGKLKIFFGASAGVGKTYAMLAAARAARVQEVTLIVGLVESHGRAETEAMAQDLPRLSLRSVSYRDHVLQEFDLDAALEWAKAQAEPLILLDELAHSNAPGSRHLKRWQDVQEMLDAGIDVWSTMNVQHLESLNDIVSGITGIRVWETVPDRLFDEADEVVVVDLPPDELLDRLKAGKVYLPQHVERATNNFFRKGNLLALRELALRRTADRVDGEMQAWRRRSSVQSVWPNREALLACIGVGDGGEKVVRASARLAAQLNVSWHAVTVETTVSQRWPDARRDQVLRVLKLAQQLGATVATPAAPAVAPALVRYARDNNLSRLVIGRTRRRWPWQQSPADRIAALADELDVVQLAQPVLERARSASEPSKVIAGKLPWSGYAAAVTACLVTALLATPLLGLLELTNIVMVFLLAVVGVGWFYGRGPAVLAAFLGVALFDFSFVPPRFTFEVSDVQYLVTFAVMLVVALAIGQLTAVLKVQAEAATQREHRMRRLYEMSRDLSAALLPEQVAEIGARFLTAEFRAKSTLLAADAHDRLVALPRGSAAVDDAVAQWAFDRGEPAGFGTDTLAASACLVLPLKAPMRLRGVLALEPADRNMLGPDQRRLLDTCASLLAISLERIHYIDVAQKSTVQIESERLRNSLLSAISHDLRTPLAAMVGLADTLVMTPPPLSTVKGELAASIRESALRMNAMVGNLLDMARLEAGAVPMRREWQPLEEVVGSALAACASALQGRPIQVKLADDLPLLELDAVLFERVLVNLLENAVKYTPAGSAIELSATASPSAVSIHVDDFGPGLPVGREEALFNKFERGSKESTMPGVGLGLAIARAIVLAHHGSIRGENRSGPSGTTGARFTIELPRGEPPVDDGSTSAIATV
ncbi:MAG: DUF4118 domain-containing protein [Betaproteobacteria bacterium]